MKTKPDMYKIWRSKQTSGFCGTRVQVGRYSGIPGQEEICPNCGRRETATPLLLCPSEDRTQLLIDNADELETWLEKDGSTDQELAYWIPKYILMRGDKPFADMGTMSSRMKALARSQDEIGYATSWKVIFRYISNKYKTSIWQCPAASSTVPIGLNNLS
jgi:hypothetical protein